MKIPKVVAQARLTHAECLTCDEEGYVSQEIGPRAEAFAYTHAQENDGHRVQLTETWTGIYQRREMT
jgi:hypothetical protein